MKKNPFSLYDFLGYVFPGMLSLVLLYSVYTIVTGMGGNYVALSVKDIVGHIFSGNRNLGWEDTIVFIILSYCVGHIIAYASSLTVEKVSIWMYGYPSAFIMGNSTFFNKIRNGLFKRSFWKGFYEGEKGAFNILKRTFELIWKVGTCFFMLPVTICCTVLGYVFQVQNLYIKPVDEKLNALIQNKTEKLMQKLGEQGKVDFKTLSSDYHRLIYNFEYEKQEAHRHKMDNYVAIYGFLRALTFIFNCLFMAYLLYVIKYGIPFLEVWIQLISLMGLTYLVFMSFMKFYRRFTMESFMCLSIDTDIF